MAAVQERRLVSCHLKHLQPRNFVRARFKDLPPNTVLHGLIVIEKEIQSLGARDDIVAFKLQLPDEDRPSHYWVEVDKCIRESGEWSDEGEDGLDERRGDVSEGESSESSSDDDDDREVELDWQELKAPPENLSTAEPCTVNFDHLQSTRLQYFLHFLPLRFFTVVVVRATNAAAKRHDPHWKDVSATEFLQWIGIWLFISLFQGHDRRKFWHSGDADAQFLLPNLNGVMSRTRFEHILRYLTLTDAPADDGDRFYTVRQMIDAWNKHMTACFRPGARLCFDESMVPWSTRATCPGWVHIKAKPTRQGNEYHTLADCQTSIIIYIELLEGRHQPAHKVPQHSALGKTAGMVVRAALSTNIQNSHRVIVMDAGFAVTKVVTTLRHDYGLHAIVAVKKKKHWPKHFPGDIVNRDAREWDVGDCYAAEVEVDDTNFHIVAMREPDYNFMFMSTCSTTEPSGVFAFRKYLVRAAEEDGGAEGDASGAEAAEDEHKYEIELPEIVATYYSCRHAVDDNNHLRQGSVDLERAWNTKTWHHRQLAFILSLTCTNAFLAFKYLSPQNPKSNFDFREQVARELMKYNVREKRKAKEEAKPLADPLPHQLERVPDHCTVVDNRFVESLKKKEVQRHCMYCHKLTVFYCVCDINKAICAHDFAKHMYMKMT